MKAFTIDAENNIVVHASAKAAPKTEGTELFTSQDALAELAAATLEEMCTKLGWLSMRRSYGVASAAVGLGWESGLSGSGRMMVIDG
jgi:hypothetical protein